MGRTPPSRVNLKRILDNLRVASRKGDRAALALAVDQMKTLALSPRYWERYLGLLRNPLARLVDLLVIKQGERIAHQKGWRKLGGGLRPPSDGRHAPDARSSLPPPSPGLRGQSPRSTRRRSPRPRSGSAADQPSLFD
jgi:hypothetical protein